MGWGRKKRGGGGLNGSLNSLLYIYPHRMRMVKKKDWNEVTMSEGSPYD
jgi:hypothetical protein